MTAQPNLRLREAPGDVAPLGTIDWAQGKAQPSSHEARVMGVDVLVSAAGTPDAVRKLEGLSEETAFVLSRIETLDAGSLVDPALYRCRYLLRSETGTVGDAQIYELLRRVAACARWLKVDKIASHRRARDGKPA